MSVTGVTGQNSERTYSGTAGEVVGEKTSDVVIPLSETFSQMVQEKREECYVRIREGNSEPSYQIGAGSYTEKEWERLMKSFDAIQEALRKAAGLETKDDKSGCLVEASEKYEQPVNINMLMEEYVSCSYPAANPGEEEEKYMIVYDSEGIRCINMMTGECEWAVQLTEPSQYEKIADFLSGFAQGENLRFASHENFWQDFLEDKIDLEDFGKFWETKVTDGVPNYLITTKQGAYIDSWAAKYAVYMNPSDFMKELEVPLL